jgi:hypothetical protein
MRFILLFLFGWFQISFARVDQTEAGSRARALGGAFTAVGGDVWAIAFNAGGLSRIGGAEASFDYSPSPFGVRELSVEEFAIGVPARFGVICLAARNFGSELYREMRGTVAYANSIPHAGFGVGLNYHSVRISRYGSAGALVVDAGALVEASGELNFGLSVKNVTGATIGESGEPLPQVYAIGMSYLPAEQLLLAIEFRKESGYEASPRFGLEYRIENAIAVRIGFPDVPSAYTGGLGIRFASLQIDYAFMVHQELGWTQEVTLSVRWGSRHD